MKGVGQMWPGGKKMIKRHIHNKDFQRLSSTPRVCVAFLETISTYSLETAQSSLQDEVHSIILNELKNI